MTELSYSDWKETLRGGELVGQACEECGNVTASPKAACTECGSRSVSRTTLPEDGVVYSETTINVPPEGYERGYKVGIVELGDTGARVLGRLDETAEIGDEVVFDDTFEHDDEPAPVFESK